MWVTTEVEVGFEFEVEKESLLVPDNEDIAVVVLDIDMRTAEGKDCPEGGSIVGTMEGSIV